jgi:hypothetical protein
MLTRVGRIVPFARTAPFRSEIAQVPPTLAPRPDWLSGERGINFSVPVENLWMERQKPVEKS